LRGGSAPFVVALLAQYRPVAFILNEPREIFTFADELGAWLGKERVLALLPRNDPILPWPHSEDAGHPERYRALAALKDVGPGSRFAFILPSATLLQRIGARAPSAIDIFDGAEVEREDMLARLVECGYQPAAAAYEPGEFAVRGGIVDIYPPGGSPFRIEFEGDSIYRLRYYDPASQRSVGSLDRITVVPMAEVPLDEETRSAAADRIKEYFSPSEVSEIAERIRSGTMSPEELSRYLPFFWTRPVSILDRLPPDTLLIFEDGGTLSEQIHSLWEKLMREHSSYPDKSRLPEPDMTYWPAEQLEDLLSQMSFIELGGPAIPGRERLPTVAAGAMDNDEIRDEIRDVISGDDDRESAEQEYRGALGPLLRRLRTWREMEWRIVFTSSDGVSGARFEALLREYGEDVSVRALPEGLLDGAPPPGELALVSAPLSKGFRMASAEWAVVTEEEVFGPKVRRYRPAAPELSDRIEDLHPGDPVVHMDHGIGLFHGIVKLAAGGDQNDCARIEYANEALLYLPVHRMNLIEPYSVEDDKQPVLDRLGGAAWAKSVARARKAAAKIARELVELYAARKVFEGNSFPSPDSTYREFEATFPYEETPDQARAISDVIKDMESTKPMDRLICGDVGYGKTEVALRAAFLAAMEGKQVALLVPTTLLAHQHYRTFRQRLEPYPLRVEMLSRLRTGAQIKQTLQDLAAGKVDILIGTHRLLQKDVKFRDLGLLIIDEEHRFGVKHKEKIKGMKRLVDVMTLTATPIPRTLQLSLLGIWDMSNIDTPPPDRMAVRTKVVPFDDDIVRDAIHREISRGGQVYFVVPKIKNIDEVARFIYELVPDVRLGIAHGRLNALDLERVMMDFVEGRLDILLCTSIIESGIDIPRANTILIYNAHMFGLATLYQLRGRVGRSKERAYAYLITPGKLTVSRRARKRLRALEEFTALGSGYRIARLDLKIRGAGNILGEVQAGHINRIGYDLYLDLLGRAIRELKGEKIEEEIEPEIQIPMPAYLPEEYVPDPQDRVILYRRLSRTRNEQELLDIKGELLDRFGTLPESAETLLGVISLKNILRKAKVKSIKREGRALRLTFDPQAPVISEKAIKLVNEDPRKFRLAPENEILVIPALNDMPAIVSEISDVLKRITERDTINELSPPAQAE